MVATFGRGRSAGSGWLAYSNRAGPGVLVTCERRQSDFARAFARTLCSAGLTALVLDSGERAGPVDHWAPTIGAAADYLTENWHPRLGVVALAGVSPAIDLAARRDPDAVVLVECPDDVEFSPVVPVLQLDPGPKSDGEHLELDVQEIIDFLRYHLS
jgi:hypothetical protein